LSGDGHSGEDGTIRTWVCRVADELRAGPGLKLPTEELRALEGAAAERPTLKGGAGSATRSQAADIGAGDSDEKDDADGTPLRWIRPVPTCLTEIEESPSCSTSGIPSRALSMPPNKKSDRPSAFR